MPPSLRARLPTSSSPPHIQASNSFKPPHPTPHFFRPHTHFFKPPTTAPYFLTPQFFKSYMVEPLLHFFKTLACPKAPSIIFSNPHFFKKSSSTQLLEDTGTIFQADPHFFKHPFLQPTSHSLTPPPPFLQTPSTCGNPIPNIFKPQLRLLELINPASSSSPFLFKPPPSSSEDPTEI